MEPREKLSEAAYFTTLHALYNPRSVPICRTEHIEYFWRKGVPLADLVQLFSYEDNQQNERFFADSVKFFMEEGGYSIQDLLEVAELKDHTGKSLINSSNDFWDFSEAHGKIDDAKALAAIRDSEGFAIYRYDERWDQGFDGFRHLGEAVAQGWSAEKIQELVDIKDDAGVSVFRSPRDIHRFLESKGSRSYAESLVKLKDHENNHIFDEFSIALLQENDASVAFASKMASLRDTDGQVIFSNGIDIVHYFPRFKNHSTRRFRKSDLVGLAKDTVALSDNKGQTIFRDGDDIITALKATNANLDEIRSYIAVENAHGDTYFNGADIALLLQHKVPVEYAAKLAGKGLNAATIMYNYKIGLGSEEVDFSNSGKPKALILYPTDDPKGFFSLQSFSDEDTFVLLTSLREEYDVKIRAISSDDEFFAELDKATDVYYSIWGGHGSSKGIQFGSSNPKYKRFISEASAKLTTSHTKLRESLRQLPSLKYIMLDSCLTGEGKEGADNMVNFVADCGPGITVTGPADATNASKTKFNSIYPPDVKMLACYTYEDCTYTRRIPVA